MAGKRIKALVVCVGFEANFVLQRNGKGNDQIQGRYLGEKVGLSTVCILIVALLSINPYMAGKITRGLTEFGPVSSSVYISFIC